MANYLKQSGVLYNMKMTENKEIKTWHDQIVEFEPMSGMVLLLLLTSTTEKRNKSN